MARLPVCVDGNGTGLIAQSQHAFDLADSCLPLSACECFPFRISHLYVKKWLFALALGSHDMDRSERVRNIAQSKAAKLHNSANSPSFPVVMYLANRAPLSCVLPLAIMYGPGVRRCRESG